MALVTLDNVYLGELMRGNEKCQVSEGFELIFVGYGGVVSYSENVCNLCFQCI